MRRFITITILVVLIVLILVGGVWFFNRRTAVKNGSTPPSFREFLNFNTKDPTKKPGDSGLSSDFTNPPPITTPPETTPSGSLVTTSQFTSGPLTPTQNPGSTSSSSNTGSLGSDNIDDSTKKPKPTIGTGGGAGTTTSTSASARSQQCSDADVMIEFTPEEIQKLNALQNRFYVIAGALHSDHDVQLEVQNYDEFKAKSDQISELFNYCASTVGQIQNPNLQNRISTPYWRDPTRDGDGYFIHAIPTFQLGTFTLNSDVIDPRDVTKTQGIIERVFRLNLW